MAVQGSDCVTGKRQYADRQAASDAASAGRARGWLTYSYRCGWCRCYHIGNRKGSSSKSRRVG